MSDFKKRIGEILVEDGILSKESLEDALNQQKKSGGLLGQILIQMGYVSEEELTAAIGKQLKVPYLPLPNYSINANAAHKFGEDFCRRNLLMAFDHDEKNIYVSAVCPIEDTIISEIEKISGLKAQIFMSMPSEILSMLDLMFRSNYLRKETKKAG